MTRSTTAVVLGLSLAARSLAAQDGPAPDPRVLEGRRVRIQTIAVDGTTPILTGRLLQYTVRHAVIETGRRRTVVIPGETITDLEVSAGRGSRWRRAAAGAAIGAALGGVIGLVAGDDTKCSFICFSAGDKALIFGTLLTPVGALAGAATPPSEKWVRPPSPSPAARGRGPGMGMTLVALRW